MLLLFEPDPKQTGSMILTRTMIVLWLAVLPLLPLLLADSSTLLLPLLLLPDCDGISSTMEGASSTVSSPAELSFTSFFWGDSSSSASILSARISS